MSKKEVATMGNAFPTERPDFIKEETMRGSEDVGTNDVTVPRLQIIQDLSPQHKKNKPEFIEGAEVGMCFNTATKQLYGKEIFVVPCYFRKEWLLWKDINSGGGFGGSFDDELTAAKARNEQEQPDLWEVQDTHQHFCLMVDAASDMANPIVEQIVLSMSVSQMKPSREWNTMIQTLRGDRFSRVYKVQVVEATNKANQDYYNYKIDHMGFVSEPLFKLAENLYEAVKTRKVEVEREVSSSEPVDNFGEDEFS